MFKWDLCRDNSLAMDPAFEFNFQTTSSSQSLNNDMALRRVEIYYNF